jgi:hypothetical protein
MNWKFWKRKPADMTLCQEPLPVHLRRDIRTCLAIKTMIDGQFSRDRVTIPKMHSVISTR